MCNTAVNLESVSHCSGDVTAINQAHELTVDHSVPPEEIIAKVGQAKIAALISLKQVLQSSQSWSKTSAAIYYPIYLMLVPAQSYHLVDTPIPDGAASRLEAPKNSAHGFHLLN